MKSTIEINMTIPPEIAALQLSLNERFVLACIAGNPRCKNKTLAKKIGMTERGVKNILQRLRTRGHVTQTGKGRARRLQLQFPVEQGTQFPISNECVLVPNGEIRAPSCRTRSGSGIAQSLADDFEETLRSVDQITKSRKFYPETVVMILGRLIGRIEAEMPDSPQKTEILSELYARQGAFLAIGMAVGLPEQYQRALDERISGATVEQLIEFRERFQAGQLGVGTTPLMLANAFPGAG